jgi:PIN domain nuclease of toxin-antitoxin system
MDYLLDTQAFLWFINGSSELSERARNEIENTTSDKWVSIASIWEIAINLSLGKLTLSMDYEELISHVFDNGFKLLDLIFEDTILLTKLEFHHKDPFDRILICQATRKGLQIITRDTEFSKYKVGLVWN